MPELSAWRDLPHAGVIHPGDTEQVRTGGWRTGVKPTVDLSLCVNCLLCWLYCPDSAITLDGTVFDRYNANHLSRDNGSELPPPATTDRP